MDRTKNIKSIAENYYRSGQWLCNEAVLMVINDAVENSMPPHRLSKWHPDFLWVFKPMDSIRMPPYVLLLAEYLPSFCLDLLKGSANVFAVEVFLIGKKSDDCDK